jgi:hypothetical protein
MDRVAPSFFHQTEIMEEEEQKSTKPTLEQLKEFGVDYGKDDDGNQFYLWAKDVDEKQWYKVTRNKRIIRIK